MTKTTKPIKRDSQTRYLSQAIQLEEAVNPHIIRATLFIISLSVITFLTWAGFTNINEVARASGEVVPQGYEQIVQHFEGGVVKAIHVEEGDIVEQGQPLLTLNESILKEDLQRVQVKQLDLELKAERLRAFTEDRHPDFNGFQNIAEKKISDQQSFFAGMIEARQKERNVLAQQIDAKTKMVDALHTEKETVKTQLSIAQDFYNRRQELNRQGYASDMQLLQDQQNLNQYKGELQQFENRIIATKAEIEDLRNRRESLVAKHHDEALEKLSAVLSEQDQNIKVIDKLQERLGRLDITAPSKGLVKGLTINTVGAVIQPGETLLEIVPMHKDLLVTVKINPKDIGHLEIGQQVQVKFSSFDFSRYGSVTGVLNQISATTFSSTDGGRYYHGRIFLNQNFVGNDRRNIILPGMTVMADIITGEKTILQYMLKPIHISLKTAFTER